MKKIISGMLIFASLAGGMSAFTSCKDTDDDQYAVLQREDFRLMQQIQDLQTALDQAKTKFEQDLAAAKADLNKQISEGYGSTITFKELAEKVKLLEGQICQCGDIAQKLANLKTEILTEINNKGYLDQTALKNYLDQNGYLTTIPDEYITESELNTKLNDYLTKTGLKTEVDKFINTYGYLTAATLKDALDQIGYKNYDDTNLKNDINELREALQQLGFTVSTGSDGTITVTPPEWATQDSEALKKAVAEAQWVATNKTALENLITTLGSLDPSKLLTKEEAGQTYLTKEDFEEYKNGLTNALDEFVTTYNNVAKDFDMKADFANLTELLTDWVQWRKEIAGKVAANEEAIKVLRQKYDLVNQRLDAMITSIVAEGTWNPVFGTFAVPAGVASNVAMAYYGEMGRVEFPYDGTMYEFDGTQVITTKDMQMLGVTPQTFEGTVLLGEENGYKGNAGTIYMTVNPGNADMTGKTFTLVNSQNQGNGMAIETPVKSDAVLTFGYSHGRAAQDVSLYEAGATLTPENIESCRVEIEPGLKSAAAEFIKDYRNNGKLASLMRAVYEQLNGILPRMAVKAEWSYTTSKWDDTSAAWVDATEQGIVRSGLDIAATAFKPLSYKSLEGKKFNRRLPILEEININWDKLIPEIQKIEIKPIDLSDIKIDFKLSDVDFSDINKDLIVTVKGEVDIKGEKQEIELTGKVDPENLQRFIDQMAEAFREQVKNSNDDINEQFKKVMSELQENINNMILNVNSQINDMFDKLVEDLKNNIEGETGKYFDKVNNFINRYNSLAKRINKVLENPNHYMQVTMLFKNSEGGFSFLSTNPGAPSNFSLGAGNSLLLFPTSYNAEIISPAFKKFVGVCDVVNLATGKSAQEGDAAAKAALDKANNGAEFDKVIDGTNLRVATGELTAGFKYVVAYSALDYRGFTSTNKYYFQVNK